MQLVHSALRSPPRASPVKKRRLSPDEERAEKRLLFRQEKDAQEAMKAYPKEIKEIQEWESGWKP